VGTGSIFFEKFFAALDGRAGRDGIVTVDDLVAYLRREVQISTDQQQNPLPGDLSKNGSLGGFFFFNRRPLVEQRMLPAWNDAKGVPFGTQASTPNVAIVAPDTPSPPPLISPPLIKNVVTRKAYLSVGEPRTSPIQPDFRRLYDGTIVWQLITENGRTSVRGLIEVPKANLKASLSMQRKTSSQYNIDLRFDLSAGGPISNVNVKESKIPELVRDRDAIPDVNLDEKWVNYDPLRGVAVTIRPNIFSIELSPDIANRAANTKLLTTRSDLKIPLVFDNGGLADMTLEIGGDGNRMFSDTFAEWAMADRN
jgi:hypothetical protein